MNAVAESDTFDDHLVDNAALFSAVLAADAKTALLIHNFAAESCLPSYFVAWNKLLAFV